MFSSKSPTPQETKLAFVNPIAASMATANMPPANDNTEQKRPRKTYMCGLGLVSVVALVFAALVIVAVVLGVVLSKSEETASIVTTEPPVDLLPATIYLGKIDNLLFAQSHVIPPQGLD